MIFYISISIIAFVSGYLFRGGLSESQRHHEYCKGVAEGYRNAALYLEPAPKSPIRRLK